MAIDADMVYKRQHVAQELDERCKALSPNSPKTDLVLVLLQPQFYERCILTAGHEGTHYGGRDTQW